MSSARRAAWTSALLLGLGAARLLLLVLHEPMHGYANNYDFIRIESWFHLWADPAGAPEDFDPRRQHPSAPISTYRIAPEIEGDLYYVTSDLIFVRAALAVAGGLATWTGGDPARFDLRILGVLRVVCLTAAAVFITARFAKRSPRAGIVSALVFAGVLADPAFSLLFNTLYSDFSTVLFCYLAGAETIHAIAFGPPSPSPALPFALVLLLLAAAKAQFGALSLVLAGLVAAATLALHSPRLRHASTWLGLALLFAGAGAGWALPLRLSGEGGYAWSLRMATATDTYLGAVLPHADDATAGLRILGLPERCAPYVGKTWYDPGMQPPPCPEVADVPRTRLVRLFVREPSIVFRMARRAVPLLQQFVVRSFGQVEGGHYQQADLRLAIGLASAATWIEALPAGAFAVLLALTLGGVLVAAIDLPLAHARGAAGGALLLPALVLVVGTVEWYAFTSALFGDGYIGLGRHSLLGQLAFLVLLVTVPCELGRLVRRRETLPLAAAS